MKKSFKIVALCFLSSALFSSCSASGNEEDLERNVKGITPLEKEVVVGKFCVQAGAALLAVSGLGFGLYHYIEDKKSWNPRENAVDMGIPLYCGFGLLLVAHGLVKWHNAAKKLKDRKEG